MLEVESLAVRFNTEAGSVQAVNDVSFTVRSGETLAMVGESGSGKSVTSLAVMRLTPRGVSCSVSGRVLLRDRNGRTHDVLRLPDTELRSLRGDLISMVFQEPMTSLNPVLTVGEQIVEAILVHRRVSPAIATERAIELLDRVGIPEPRRRLATYPHHLSGGMRQRVMIAIALSCDPLMLIADEPTTALDVTIQAQILELLKRLQEETGMAVVFITHNLGVVAEIADRVVVMYAGRVVEQAAVGPLFRQPLMPYTAGLLSSVPVMRRVGQAPSKLEAIAGNIPDALHMPAGCSFAPRCRYVVPEQCEPRVPQLEWAAADREVRCVRWREIGLEAGRA